MLLNDYEEVTDPALIEHYNNLAKKQSEKSDDRDGGDAPKKDFSQQYKRNWGDAARDVGYGFAKGNLDVAHFLNEGLKMGKFPGAETLGKGIEYAQQAVEPLQSPYPSPNGEWLKFGGSMIGPGGVAAKYGTKIPGVASVLAKIRPQSTKAAANTAFDVSREAAREAKDSIKINENLLKDISAHLEENGIPSNHLMSKVKAGDLPSHLELNTLLRSIANDAQYGSGKGPAARHLANSALNELRSNVSSLTEKSQKAIKHYDIGLKKIGEKKESSALGHVANHGMAEMVKSVAKMLWKGY